MINGKRLNRFFLDNKCNTIIVIEENPKQIVKHKGWYNVRTAGEIQKVMTGEEFEKFNYM